MVQILKREDWRLFENISTLGQKAGVGRDKILQLVAKELTDNALDAGAAVETDLLPDGAGFYVQDDGDGIPGTDADLLEMFSINRPLISSKWQRLPTRGALGNGLRVVAGAMFSLGAQIRVETRGRVLQIEPGDDGKATGRRICEKETTGTRIEFNHAGELPDDLLTWSNLAQTMDRGKTYAGKPSLFWYDTDTLQSILQTVPAGVSIRQFLADTFDGCSGRKAGKITADLQGRDANSLTIEETDQLLRDGRQIVDQVTPRRLGHVGRLDDQLAYDRTETRFIVYPERGTQAAEIPVILEVWALPERHFDDRAGVLFVNRTPTTGDFNVWINEKYAYFHGCGLYHNKDKKRKNPPGVCLNVTAPYIPLTSDGKAPDLSQIKRAVSDSVEKVANIGNRKAAKNEPAKRSQIDIIRANLWPEIDKISRGGKIRYTLRQLFYNVRPHIMTELNLQPDYNYFCSIVTTVEDETGADLPGILRDDRGVFIHPFDGQEIPLGTAAVENYRLPEYQFSKVLYIEKRGLFQLLKDEQIPQRYDLALMSTAGFANRAARDLIDLIGEAGEPVQFFCIHDADASGTLIYDKLVNETKARGARSVEVIDLGLHPREAVAMGLQVETFKSKGRRAVGADYLDFEYWFQSNRVELDAMPPDVFIRWICGKLDDYHAGKLIPPADYLQDHVENELRDKLREHVEQRLREELKFSDLVEERFKAELPDLLDQLARRDLVEETSDLLADAPAQHWPDAAGAIVADLLRGAELEKT